MTWWHTFIALHALAALAAFWAGLRVLQPLQARGRPLTVRVYQAGLVGMLVFVLGAMAAHWHEITAQERLVFSGLVVLALYMLQRALHAYTVLRKKDEAKTYVGDVGFTLIALFNGFVIVGAIDLGAPAWFVAGGAVVATVTGSRILEHAKRKATN